MSTNPPNAVRIPRKTSNSFFTWRSPVALREALEVVRELIQWRGDLLEAADLGAPRRDPHLRDDVARVRDDRQQGGADLVRRGVGRLDRGERVPGRFRIGLGVRDR